MTLVERFVEFSEWPTSRKTAWLSGLLLLLVILGSLVFDVIARQLPWVDAQRTHNLLWSSAAIFATIGLCSQLVASRGREGRWTFYLLAIPLGVFIATISWLFGTTSTALVALYPIVVMEATVVYGVRRGAFAFVYGFALTVLIILLQAKGVIPFAPIFLNRSLDAQSNVIFMTGIAFCVISMFAAVLVLVAALVAAQRLQREKLDRIARLIRRYIPSQLAERIIAGQHSEASKAERAKLTVFFSDLVGFTDIAEQMEPEDLSRVLNEYFSEMTRIAERHGGTVDELSGDAILIFFGAPNATNDKDHALRAARMAIEMREAVEALNAGWRAAGIGESLRVRMGINTGVVTVGNFGSPERMKYAALGKHVNVAARLQSYCEPGKVLLSHSTWLLISDQVDCAPKGELQLKGIHKPVMSYELKVQS